MEAGGSHKKATKVAAWEISPGEGLVSPGDGPVRGRIVSLPGHWARKREFCRAKLNFFGRR